MTKTLMVLQHHEAEGIGRIGLWAKQHQWQVISHMAPELFTQLGQHPATFDRQWRQQIAQVDGLIILGGPTNVQDNPPWMAIERQCIRIALAEHLPIFAICLGAQLVAAELGAQIKPLAKAELGWQSIDFTHADSPSIKVLQWHEYGFEFSPTQHNNIAIEASSQGWPQQIYRLPKVMGVQFHPEWDLAQIGKLKQAFGQTCPFDLSSKASEQATIEHWLFNQLDQLFIGQASG
ncbi:type 1 glutamine amidotransferase [Shewanella maritima]|uniref:type 1 glutamine amidotransferase n=1 Tax=Shewanella maritima TaxID=2520507 RepID=UPI00373672AD